MKNKEDNAWQELLARSASTFEAETAPPFGFMTRTLSRLREERSAREEMEKMGRWAVFASLAVLGVVMVVTVDLQIKDSRDFDPGLRSIIQAENVQIY